MSADLESRLLVIANEFGRVRDLLSKRITVGNSPCAARKAMYQLRRGNLDAAIGYCETAVQRDAEWTNFAALVRDVVNSLRA